MVCQCRLDLSPSQRKGPKPRSATLCCHRLASLHRRGRLPLDAEYCDKGAALRKLCKAECATIGHVQGICRSQQTTWYNIHSCVSSNNLYRKSDAVMPSGISSLKAESPVLIRAVQSEGGLDHSISICVCLGSWILDPLRWTCQTSERQVQI